MNSFYGNQYKKDYVPLVWDKIYKSYSEMASSAQTDGIMVGRCVFVDGSDNSGYAHTVWQKVSCTDTEDNIRCAYKLIACLDSKRDYGTGLEVKRYAPSANTFKLEAPVLNTNDNAVTGDESDTTVNIDNNDLINMNDSTYYRVNSTVDSQSNTQTLTIESQPTSGYTLCLSDPWKIGYSSDSTFNVEGFDRIKQSKKVDENNKSNDFIKWKETLSDDGREIGYIDAYKDDNTSTPIDKYDTKLLLVNLPGIGNAISDMWDLIYPIKDGSEDERDTSAWPKKENGKDKPLAEIAKLLHDTCNPTDTDSGYITDNIVDDYMIEAIEKLSNISLIKSNDSTTADTEVVIITEEGTDDDE